MKILVVAHKQVNKPGEYYDFPLGIAYISSALKGRGFQVSCLNLNHYPDHLKTLLQTIKDTQAEVVCLGGLSAHYLKIEELHLFIRKHAPQLISIIGGGLITSEPEIVYAKLTPDYGVIGEGEETISQLIRALEQKTSVADIDGIIFRDGKSGKITITQPRKSMQNIDKIDFPDYEGFEIGKYLNSQKTNDLSDFHALDAKPRMLPIISSRGCPYNCSFCFHPLGKQYRVRSLDNFFSELEQLIHRYGINYFCVYDELLSANKRRIYEFCKRMETYHVKWMTQLRVDSVDEELLLALKKSGCTLISYGIESASNVVLKSMGKGITIEQVERALVLTRNNHICLTGNLIFGDRAETMKTVAESFDWYSKHTEYLLGLGMISAYPGSPLYQYAKEKNMIPNLDSFLTWGGGIINVTKIPDAAFKRIRIRSQYTSLKAHLKHRVKLRQLTMAGLNDIGETSFEFTTHCPNCNAVNNYKDFNVGSRRGAQLLCKTCLQKGYISFHVYQDYGELFIFWFLAHMPLTIGFHLFNFYRNVRSLSRFTLRQNLIRLRNRLLH